MKNWKKTALTIGSITIAASLAVGGTLAYQALTHDDEGALNTYTVGEAVDIAINEYQRNEDRTALEAFEQGKELLPIVGSAQESPTGVASVMDNFGMPIADNYGDKIVTIKNTGDAAAKIRVYIAQPLALTDFAGDTDAPNNTSDDAIHWNWGNRVKIKGGYNKDTYDPNSWEWTSTYPDFIAEIDNEDYIVTVFESKTAVAAGIETSAVMSGIYLDSKVDYDDGIWTMGDYIINYDLSKGVHIPVYAEAVAEDVDFEDAATVFKQWADSVKAPAIVTSADALIAGGSAVLDGDIALEGAETWLNADANINLGDSTISADRSDASSAQAYSALTIAGNVTIDGVGKVENTGDGYGITVKGEGAKLTINGGTYKGGTTAINVVKGDLVITGGTFEDTNATDNGHYLINCIDANYRDGSATVTITGGKFKNWNPNNNTSEGAGTDFVPAGYTVVEEVIDNATWYTVVAE